MLAELFLSMPLNLRTLASYIAEVESRSGISFHDAQIALARLQIGSGYGKDLQNSKDKKEVTITLAVPTTEAFVVTDKTEGEPNSSSTSVNKKKSKTVTVRLAFFLVNCSLMHFRLLFPRPKKLLWTPFVPSNKLLVKLGTRKALLELVTTKLAIT